MRAKSERVADVLWFGRKLDGHKIKDVEDLDLITETFSPVVVATTKPLTKSASIRSLSRR